MHTLALLTRALPAAHERISAPSHAEAAAIQVTNEICKDMTAKILGAVADDIVLYKQLMRKLDCAVLESADAAARVQEIVEQVCARHQHNTPIVQCAIVDMPAFLAYRQIITFINAHQHELATAEDVRALLNNITASLPCRTRNKLLVMNQKQWYAVLSPAAFKECILYNAPVPPRKWRWQHALANLTRVLPNLFWTMHDITIDIGGPAYKPVQHSARHKYIVFARTCHCAASTRKGKYIFWQDARGLTHFIAV